MKSRILFVCIGQAGGNIGQLFYEKGYNTFLINSSYEDLKSSSIPDKFKHYIVGANGCSKDREKGLQLAKENWRTILDLINSKYPQQDIVFFIFSAGGGTGSGLTPSILEVSSKMYPNKNYGAVIILPSVKESLKTQINAVECIKHLSRIERLRTTFILDNNNCDKFKINDMFVDQFNTLINITTPDPRGIVDKMELEKTITTKGNIVILKLDASANIQDTLNNRNSTIFTPWEHGSKYLTLSLINDIDIEIVESTFGIPWDKFTGYNKTHNLIVASGMPMPMDRINELINTVNVKKNSIKTYNDNYEFEVPVLDIIPEFNKKEELNDEFDIDIDALFEKFAK